MVYSQFAIHNSQFTIKKRVGVLALTLFLLIAPVRGMSQGVAAKADTISHNPTKALVLSAVLPGAGQVYNHQAWKIPIIYAALGGLGYYSYFNFSQMKYYKEEYLYRVAHSNQTQYPDDPDMVATPTSNIYNLYEAYDKTFQLSVIITVAVYGINLLDAYVFGHLFDFQINDDLSFNMSPTVIPCDGFKAFGQSPFLPAASITLRF